MRIQRLQTLRIHVKQSQIGIWQRKELRLLVLRLQMFEFVKFKTAHQNTHKRQALFMQFLFVPMRPVVVFERPPKTTHRRKTVFVRSMPLQMPLDILVTDPQKQQTLDREAVLVRHLQFQSENEKYADGPQENARRSQKLLVRHVLVSIHTAFVFGKPQTDGSFQRAAVCMRQVPLQVYQF